MIDTIHRNKDTFFEQYGEEGVESEKKAISFLSRLRNELQTDKPITELSDGYEDVKAWNSYLQFQRHHQGELSVVSWFQSPWLFVECYMYRRIHEALWLNPPVNEFDVFWESKSQSFHESLSAVSMLCSHLNNLKTTLTQCSDAELLGHLLKLLQVSVWGNKCDLSISAGQRRSQRENPLAALDKLHPFLLLDDSDQVWAVLKAEHSTGRSQSSKGLRVDLVLDNAGFELVTDLVLADFLLTSGLACQVCFHGKSFPWFVSDVTAKDFGWTIKQIASASHADMVCCGKRWMHYISMGMWSYHDHSFWTLPHEYHDMVSAAPDLYATLCSSQLLLFKGDLNYRKLVGDRNWSHETPFRTALQGFQPTPLCALRTLKANVQVGLEEGHGEKLSIETPSWMTSGNYAIIQFCDSA